MNANTLERATQTFGRAACMVSRITFSLLLWTLGAANMNLAFAQTTDHRTVYKLALDRAKVEDLQRWVNAGHDPWCRDAKLVAGEALRRVSPQLPELEPVSLPAEIQSSRKALAIYTFHSVDGRATYRITLRRYLWLLPIAGSYQKMIWVPERVEVLTTNTLN